jgi:phosphohistidine phosphatase
MELLVIRHAIAEDRERFAAANKDDALRPLTADGRRKFKRATHGILGLVPRVDLLATSPLLRAADTAAILAKAYGLDEVGKEPALEPDARPTALLPWLQRCAQLERVAVVGHEPHLSSLVEWLLTGRTGRFIALKKGGACLLELGDLGDAPRAGGGGLRWLLTQRQLRQLGG